MLLSGCSSPVIAKTATEKLAKGLNKLLLDLDILKIILI